MMLRIVVLLIAVASTATAQTVTSRDIFQSRCRDSVRVADVGYGMAVCHDCLGTFRYRSLTAPRFSGSPALYQIRADGPAAGRLQEGDTLVSVDGHPITDAIASMYLVDWRPDILLGLRRSGNNVSVRINPRLICVAAEASLIPTADSLAREVAEKRYRAGAISREEYERVRGNIGVADSLARVMAKSRYEAGAITREEYERAFGHFAVADSLRRVYLKARFEAGVLRPDEYQRELETLQHNADVRGGRPLVLGFAIQCSSCSVRALADGRSVWTFAQHPVVASVEPGSFADRLGLRQGDTLIAVDGISLKTQAGGERMGSAASARELMLSWRRSGLGISARGTVLPATNAPIRTTQRVGNTTVDIRGAKALWAVDPATGRLQVSGDSITVIITPDSAAAGQPKRAPR